MSLFLYSNIKNSNKTLPLKETNLSIYCLNCNSLTTIFDKVCLNCYIFRSKNKLNNLNKIKKRFSLMSYRQGGTQHLDYENKYRNHHGIQHLDYENKYEENKYKENKYLDLDSQSETSNVCDCCVRSEGISSTSYSSKSGSKSNSETEASYYIPPKKSKSFNKNRYKNLDKNYDEWYDYWKNEGYVPSQTTLDDEESVAIICGKVNGIQTTMLLDTGSSISAITETFAQQLYLDIWYTNDVLVVTLANTHVEKYPERMCIVTLEIGDLKISEELNVLPGQIYNVTLGKNWLKSHMAICDYGLDILRLPGSRPIQMGFSTSDATFQSSNKSKRKNFNRQSLQYARLYNNPSYRTLLRLDGWLPPFFQKK